MEDSEHQDAGTGQGVGSGVAGMPLLKPEGGVDAKLKGHGHTHGLLHAVVVVTSAITAAAAAGRAMAGRYSAAAAAAAVAAAVGTSSYSCKGLAFHVGLEDRGELG
jgi:hypothetical protein